MMLGRKPHTVGNATRYSIGYEDWLDDGVSLVSGTAALVGSLPTDVTITQVAVTPSHRLVFWVTGGSLNETFTVAVRVVDSRGEIANDTVQFYIVAP